MTDDRPSTDGGETAAPMDVERAGGSPPEAPTPEGLERELPDLLGDVESVTTTYLVRAGLTDGSGRSVGEQLVAALEDKVTVVASTLDAGFDPSTPELDVLIETDHDHGAIASSLASVGPVDGVVVADVTAAAEHAIEPDEAEAPDANDVFNELKQEVGQEGYGQVVEELEDVSFPGGPDPDEEVDLEAEAGVSLSDDPEPIDLEDDELTTKQLLGEDDRETADVKAPDEQAIEEAIAEVDLGGGAAGSGTADDGGESVPPVETPSADAGAETADDAGTETDADAGTAGDAGPESASTGGSTGDAGPEPASAGGSAGDAEAESDAAGGSEDGTPAPAEQADGSEPAGEVSGGADAPAADAAAQPAGTPEEATGSVGVPGGSPEEMDAFVAGLVEALESGAIDQDRRAELREALGIESTHSLDVRMEYLQKRVDNLAAYTDAWEAFLSEEGSGRAFMESVREDLDAVEGRLGDIEAGGAGDAEARVEAVEDRLADIESTLSDLDAARSEEVSRLDSRIERVESELGQRIDTVEDALGALRAKVRTLLEWRDSIDEMLGDD